MDQFDRFCGLLIRIVSDATSRRYSQRHYLLCNYIPCQAHVLMHDMFHCRHSYGNDVCIIKDTYRCDVLHSIFTELEFPLPWQRNGRLSISRLLIKYRNRPFVLPDITKQMLQVGMYNIAYELAETKHICSFPFSSLKWYLFHLFHIPLSIKPHILLPIKHQGLQTLSQSPFFCKLISVFLAPAQNSRASKKWSVHSVAACIRKNAIVDVRRAWIAN